MDIEITSQRQASEIIGEELYSPFQLEKIIREAYNGFTSPVKKTIRDAISGGEIGVDLFEIGNIESIKDKVDRYQLKESEFPKLIEVLKLKVSLDELNRSKYKLGMN